MKRKVVGICSIIFVMVCTILLATMRVSNAAGETVDGITYEFRQSGSYLYELRVVDVPEGTETINIPQTITYQGRNYTVYTLGNQSSNMLSSLSQDKANAIKTINIPNSVYSINKNCFANLYKLEHVNIGTGVRNIYDYAFSDCGVKELILPENLSNVTTYSIRMCYNLEKLYIGRYLNTDVINSFKGSFGRKIKEISVSENNSYMKSEDNVVYTKDMKTVLLAAPAAERDNYVMPDSVENINASAFSYANLNGTVTLSPNLKTLGNNAFSSTKFENPLTLPSSLISIGNNAFYNSTLPGTLNIPDSVTSIGSSAFYGCSEITSLELGSGLQTIGSGAFQNCTGLTGEFTYNPNIPAMSNSMFRDTNIDKFIVGRNITSIGNMTFAGYKDIWIDNEEGNVSLNANIDGTSNEEIFIHWKNDKHNLFISQLPGVKIINTATNEEVVPGDYDCCTTFNYKVVVDDEHSYPNLSIIVINDNDTENMEVFDYDPNTVYEFKELRRDRKIYIQNISTTSDLALRTYIKQVNGQYIPTSRAPEANVVDGSIKYRQTKYPFAVKKNDNIVLGIRVYNEGLVDSSLNKIAVYLPENVEFISDSNINNAYGWTLEDGKYISSYLTGVNINRYNGNGLVNYVEIPINVKITADQQNDENVLRAIFAEIQEAPATDSDSEYGNVDVSNATSYMKDEIYATNTDSYFDSQEDDDDFDTLVINSKIKVEYNLKVDKISSDNDELLQGATFELYDAEGTLLKTVNSDENGAVDFGKMTSYGDGIDVFYIKEVKTPAGFYLPESKSIKIEVEKTIIDEYAGTYSVVVRCDTREYKVDTSKEKYIPISTAAQLAKIGSGETITIDGTSYEFKAEENYQLTADIDLTGINWEPINVEVKGIFDGNGHKISNLTIAKDTPTTKEIGLFSVFTGIIENVELENVSIEVGAYDENATSISGKSGTGAFVGVMREGYIINCKVSGSVESAEDNLGGFVGHTLENGMLIIDRCENNAAVTSGRKNNIGGIVGCALGSISVNNSNNKGVVGGGDFNNGGLVGYVRPSRYQDLSLSGANNEEDKELEFYVTNTEVAGEYNVILETIKKSDESLLPGATYTIYDSDKNVISGLDHVTLDEGRLKLFTKDIHVVGTDVYYIKENETVPGYDSLIGVVRADIEKYWDNETHEYKVRVTTNILTNEEYESDTIDSQDEPSRTGYFLNKEEIFTETNVAKANWRMSKAEFINCTNTANVSGVNATAGIVGASHGYTCIEKCTNSSVITTLGGAASGKTAGIIAELIAWKIGDRVSIIDCKNTATIEGATMPSGKSTAGIAAEIVADARVEKCTNSGEIKAYGRDAIAGIAGNIAGKFYFNNCSNSGTLTHEGYTEPGYDKSRPASGGIIGKHYGDITKIENVEVLAGATSTRADNEAIINNCTATGTMNIYGFTGGLVGMSCASKCDITNCSIEDLVITQKYSGDEGGLIGLANVEFLNVNNCHADGLEFTYSYDGASNATEGHVGGMVGNWCEYGSGNITWTFGENCVFTINGCTTTDSKIISRSHHAGGIIGQAYAEGSISVANCNVSNSEISCKYVTSQYSCAGGIISEVFDAKDLKINNCNVSNTPVYGEFAGGSQQCSYGGIIAFAYAKEKTEIQDCTFSESDVTNNSTGASTSNAGGIAAFIWSDRIELENINLIEANVTGHCGNVGGIVGFCQHSYSGTQFTECHMKNSNVLNNNSGSGQSNETTGGILAFSMYGANFKNCTVEGSKIEYKPMADGYIAGGSVVAAIYGGAVSGTDTCVIDGCSVKDSDIIDRGSYTGLACVASIVGYYNNPIVINNTEVTGCTIIGQTAIEEQVNPANVAGMIGCVMKGATIENSKISGCTITNNCPNSQSSNSSLSGIVGTLPGGDATIKNTEISDITLTGRVNVFGGAVANSSNGVVLDNVDIKGITINDIGLNTGRQRSIGGAVGRSKSVDIRNCTVEDIDITSASGAVGGLAGNIDTGSISNVEMSNIKIVDNNTESPYIYSSVNKIYANVGGVLGCIGEIYDYDFSAKDITIDGLEITTSFEMAGGIAGYVTPGTIFDKCTVKNATIVINKELDADWQNGSCFVGVAGENTVIKNSKVIDSSLTINEYEGDGPAQLAGGFIGYTPKAEITNSNIEGTTITNKIGCAGGVVAIAEGESSVSDITIDDVEVNSNVGVGGLAAVFKGTISKVDVTGSKVTTTANDDDGYVGGIVGVLEGTLSNSTVDGTSVTSAGGNAGGAVGSTTGTVDTVTVKNSTITSPKIAGGIVGAGLEDATTLINLTIENNTVTSAGTSGDYIGSPDIYNP